MGMWGVGEDDTKGGARPLPTVYIYIYHSIYIYITSSYSSIHEV